MSITLTHLSAERMQHNKINGANKSLCSENWQSARYPLEKQKVTADILPAFFICFWHLWRWSPSKATENRVPARPGELRLSESASGGKTHGPNCLSGEVSREHITHLPSLSSPWTDSHLQQTLSQCPVTQLGTLPSVLFTHDRHDLPLEQRAQHSRGSKQMSTWWLSE